MKFSRRSVSLSMSSRLVIGHVAVSSALSAVRLGGIGLRVERRQRDPPVRPSFSADADEPD